MVRLRRVACTCTCSPMFCFLALHVWPPPCFRRSTVLLLPCGSCQPSQPPLLYKLQYITNLRGAHVTAGISPNFHNSLGHACPRGTGVADSTRRTALLAWRTNTRHCFRCSMLKHKPTFRYECPDALQSSTTRVRFGPLGPLCVRRSDRDPGRGGKRGLIFFLKVSAQVW